MSFREPTGALSRWRIYIYKCVCRPFRIFGKAVSCLNAGSKRPFGEAGSPVVVPQFGA